MNTFRKTLIASALMGGTAAAHAELSFNIGAVSNYLFRGVTQTDDQAAIQGGMDYGFDNGIYLGTWMSNVDFDDDTRVEIDAYAGFANEVDIGSGLGYDVGTLLYHYPSCGNCDYAEIYGSLSYWWLSGGVAYTYYGETDLDAPYDEDDIYYNAAIDIPVTGRVAEVLGEGLSVSIFAGYQDFDNADDYKHYGISIAKDAGDWGSISVNVENTDGDDDDDVATEDDPTYWVGWSKGF